MKVIFLCRDSVKAKYIAHFLNKKKMLDGIIIEKGKKAKHRKLKRMFRKAKWWKYPFKILDIISIAVYSTLSTRYLANHLLKPNEITEYPPELSLRLVDDANDKACVSLLKSFQPDVLLVLGTSILKSKIIEIPRKFVLNIHGGIVPRYRNVHSEFWAVYHKDFDNIGTTIIYLDQGIDSGDIALQSAVDVNPLDSLFLIKGKNSELAGELVIQAIGQAFDESLPRVKQGNSVVGFYPTPGFLELIRMLFRFRVSK